MLKNQHLVQRLLTAVILILTGIFVYDRREELELILSLIGQGDLHWIAAGIGSQFLWILAIAASLQATYRLTGLREKLSHLIPLTTAGNFVNVVAPSYGIGAMAVFMADGRKRGKPAGKVSTASVLYMVYDYISFMLILPVGLAILSIRGALTPLISASAAIAAAIAIFVFIAAYLGFRNTDRLKAFLLAVTGFLNRMSHPFIKRDLIAVTKVDVFIAEIAAGLSDQHRSFSALILPALLALLRKAVAMLILYCSALAFGIRLDAPALFASFTIAYLFNIVSVTPSGVGFVEGALTLILNSLGVPLAEAAAITVAYRGITFWLTLAYGLVAIRIIGYTLVTPEPPLPAARSARPAPPPLRNEASFKRDPRLSP